MVEITTPSAFNERFTLYLNTEGKPLQRTLREMTAGEVLQAFEWADEEAAALQAKADAGGMVKGETEAEFVRRVGESDALAHADLLREVAEAQMRCSRLMKLIVSQMPQWQRTERVGLGSALRRWWPGGRAA